MPRAVVVLPSTTYRAADFMKAADSLGVDLIVASEQPPPFEMGDRYLQIDCSNPLAAAEAIASLGDQAAIDAVVAADDAGVEVAAIAGSKLGLLANPPEAAAATRDKSKMRVLLAAGEVPQPSFETIESGADPAVGITYPLVVKPVDRSASQGVIRVDAPEDLATAVDRIRRIVGDEKATVLAEEYVPGPELAIEGVLARGALTVLAVFDKPDMGEGPTFPETVLVTPSRLPQTVQEDAVRVSEAAIRAIGLTEGPVHIELRAGDGRPHLIEIAGRSIGGFCSRSLSFGLMGTSLESLVLRNALGTDKPELKREPSSSGVLMIPTPGAGRLDRIEGLDDTRQITGVTGLDISLPDGAMIEPLPEGDRYIGFVYARGSSPEAVEASLRKAMATIRVVVA